MRLHPVWGLILFFLAALATGSLAYGAEIPGGTPDGYERREMEGFTVYINKEVFKHPVDRFGRHPLTVLERELNDLRRILVPRIVSVLQEAPVWAEWDRTSRWMPNALALYYHRGSESVLREHDIDERKSGCIEVLSLRILGEQRSPGTALQQIVILHEMAHAVQDRMIGWDNPELLATFQQAVERKLYDEVNDRFGRRTRAYARSSPAEYFAEVSCAFLDSCNYFPFNYSQLQGYDPAGFAFVERVWKHPERFDTIAGRATSKGGKSASAAASRRFDVVAERTAMLTLDKLRAQLRTGQVQEARKGLEELARKYAGTMAATDAEKLLAS
ncbi:MAG TPA: hypothetical protein VH120_06395, partial [Gemmataceae bacterium]|nr:hypothetical protein [Gemmataceae bacterium]